MAVAQGADALGFVFYQASPRYIDLAAAAQIIRQLPPFITPVGLFVNADAAFVRTAINVSGIQLCQFHGDEDEAFCRQFSIPYIKAIRVQQQTNLLQCEADYVTAQALLLDTYVAGVQGGTGKTFDWAIIPPNLHKPVILAGGLTAENVKDAIRQVKPYAVDVSGGVEAQKGKKDLHKVSLFMQGVMNANVSLS